MILLDTSYLLALFNPRDSLHAKAEAWSRAIQVPLLITEYVLWEVINALSMPADRPKAHAIVKHFEAASDCEIIWAEPAFWQAGLQFHAARPDKEWSLTDCISFLVMSQRGISQALTYDHHFEQAGFEALLRRKPG